MEFQHQQQPQQQQQQQQQHQRQPQNKGRLTVYAVTTCFIGELFPPLKDGWNTGGATNVSWTIKDVERPYRIVDWHQRERQREQGRQWKRQQTRQRNPRTTNANVLSTNTLKDFDRVVFFGDSIIQHMIWDLAKKNYLAIIQERIDSGKVWVPPTASTSAVAAKDRTAPVNVNLPLSPATLQEYFSVLESSVRDGLVLVDANNNDNDNANNTNNDNANNTNTTFALVLGSTARDIIWPAEWQGPGVRPHLEAVQNPGPAPPANAAKHGDHRVEAPLRQPPAQRQSGGLLCRSAPIQRPRVLHHGPARTRPPSAFGACTAPKNGCSKATTETIATTTIPTNDTDQHEFRNNPRVRVLDFYEVSCLSGAHWIITTDLLHYMPRWNAHILELLYR
uniref:Uncharacterized protein n=1 Tax=Pseudo-nitzschia australis TaxID=44445 RepID=A0A7S4APP7_9STRA